MMCVHWIIKSGGTGLKMGVVRQKPNGPGALRGPAVPE